MMENLFWSFDQADSSENMFVMKGIMRCLLICSDDVEPYASDILTKLAQKLVDVSKNPSRPHFNHYLLESICVLIHGVSKNAKIQIPVFEKILFPIFQEILRTNVAEFMPYVFQVLALTLDLRPVGYGIPEPYANLYNFLLSPVLWESRGNIPALVRLLRSYLKVGCERVSSEQDLMALLGVFQKLVASKLSDGDAFYMLNSLVEYLPYDKLQPYMKNIFILLFTRLQNLKTLKYVKSFIVFTCLFCIKFGAAKLIEIVDNIQNGIFGMLLEKVILTDIDKVSTPMDKKICAIGLVKLLTDNLEPLVTGRYKMYWPLLLESEINLFTQKGTYDEPEEVADTFNFDATFSKLTYAAPENHDPTHVNNAEGFIVSALQTFHASNPGFLSSVVSNLQGDKKANLSQLLNNIGIKVL
ncbi:unnamed protein product [Soboliphyme baturini]|uniref:CAS_CSE1 domain-containing protein n=1 Tax=Soboliphyme baturini TaxID=241478 RepID=A0A183IBT1_9BILA|nr:unnamed protein product [Soboliphyme baturini]